MTIDLQNCKKNITNAITGIAIKEAYTTLRPEIANFLSTTYSVLNSSLDSIYTNTTSLGSHYLGLAKMGANSLFEQAVNLSDYGIEVLSQSATNLTTAATESYNSLEVLAEQTAESVFAFVNENSTPLLIGTGICLAGYCAYKHSDTLVSCAEEVCSFLSYIE